MNNQNDERRAGQANKGSQQGQQGQQGQQAGRGGQSTNPGQGTTQQRPGEHGKDQGQQRR